MVEGEILVLLGFSVWRRTNLYSVK